MTIALTDAHTFVCLSAVVQLQDALTGQPAVMAQPIFFLDGKPVRPLEKANAFYVFKNLSAGTYDLQIKFPQHVYFDHRVSLQVPMGDVLAEAIKVCTLAPTPMYSYASGGTYISGQVFAKTDGKALADVQIIAHYPGVHSALKTLQTQSCDFGRYSGRFMLALSSRVAQETEVSLTFSKAGFQSVIQEIKVKKASTQSINAEMQKL